MVSSYYTYVKKFNIAKVESVGAQVYNPSANAKIKDYYLDVIGTLEDKTKINVEMYTCFNQVSYNKSMCYLTRLYASQVTYGKVDYANYRKVYSINIVKNMDKKLSEELGNLNNVIRLNEVVTRQEINGGQIELIIINIDKLKTEKYNEDEFIKN